jgi:hypothetical protein
MQFDTEAGTWVVAGCGGKKYIGRFPSDVLVEQIHPGVYMQLEEALELVVMLMPVQTPQGPALNRVVTCQPIDGCSSPTTMEILPDYIHWFDEMKPEDRKRHENLVELGLAQMTASRAQEAGLVLPRVRPT